MNFLVDAQLPPGLARWLADQGHSAQHINDVGLAGAEDFAIWNHALGVDAIIVTKDEDFAERTARTAVGPVIVWLRIGNATNRVLLEWLEPRWSSVVQLLIDDNRLISGDRLFRSETTFTSLGFLEYRAGKSFSLEIERHAQRASIKRPNNLS